MNSKTKEFLKSTLIKFLKLFTLYHKISMVPIKTSDLKDLKENYVTYLKADECAIELTQPITIDLIPHKFTVFEKIKGFDLFVIGANNWRIWGNQGAVITADNYLLNGASREFSNKNHSIFKQISLTKPTIINHKTAVLAASGSDVYYHWMFDILPRINLLKVANTFDDIERFVLNYRANSFQKELLAKVGIDESSICISNDHWGFHHIYKKLVIPSLPSPNDYPSAESVKYLRKLFNSVLSEDKHDRLLYIQRKSSRKIVDERNLLDFLVPLGFEIIHPEKLTVEEQARTFSEAKFIIGPHGAAFTNLTFCKPRTKVIDIFSPHWINPCYWILSNHLDLDYAFILGEDIEAENEDKLRNINLDINKLKLLVNKINEI